MAPTDQQQQPAQHDAPPTPSTPAGPPLKKHKPQVAPSPPKPSPHSVGIDVEYTAPPPDTSDTDKPSEPKKTFCKHDVSLPESHPSSYDFSALKFPDNPVKTYPFSLDAFQRQSIMCIERKENVLVAAHTSAGKTVVAEYAIGLALGNNQRVIYTSPIKALSNQKFRELQQDFHDVGLMTGDNTIDKNASCLVMTTEILRSMLYRGSEVVREVAWVIFDEVHYMRNKDRGVVWEEAIILLPPNVGLVFLSATIPNAREFSEWIAHLKRKPCHTIYTPTRPVPLMHYLYPVGAGAGIHLIVDEKGNFVSNNFDKAMAEIASAPANRSGPATKRRGRGGGNSGKADCYKVIEMIRAKGYHPVIVFSFSRRDCESFAMQLSKLEFNTKEESAFVKEVFQNAINSLNEEDRTLPQITAILSLLQRGIGIHHSGLLPIIKEVVELLFGEGLIKCLFATETFAMGVNMPARTVLFTMIRKFDGEKYSYLTVGDYVQMSGRAGRRGVDNQGVTILMCDEKIEPGVAKSLMCGSSEPLTSTFRLGYNMLLNLMRAEEADPEYVIVRSFAQFQGDRKVPKIEAYVNQLEVERDGIRLGGQEFGVQEHEVRGYFKLKEVAESLKKVVRDIVHQPGSVAPFLQAGRLTRVHVESKQGSFDFGWGAIVDFKKRDRTISKTDDEERYKVDVLLRCIAGSGRNGLPWQPYKPPPVSKTSDPKDPRSRRRSLEEREEWAVVSVSLKSLHGLSAIRVMKPPDLRPFDNRAAFGRSIMEVLRRFPDGPPMLDPLVDMGIADDKLVMHLKKVEAIDEAMIASPVSKCEDMAGLARQWKRRQAADTLVKAEKKKLKEAKGLILHEDLKKMRRVLKRLGFTNAEGIVEVKGRVACEVNTADELVITELLLGGNMNEMSPEVLVSLCSCFVNDDGRKEEDFKLEERELQMAYDTLVGVLKRVATVKKEAGLKIDEEEYVDKFKPHAMRVVYFWMKGRSFSQVCQLSDLFEGSVIRCMRRLEELLRQLITAVKAIGNTELAEKFESGSQTLKRGIAFQSSLYV